MKGNPNDFKKKNPLPNIIVNILLGIIIVNILLGMCLTLGYKIVDKILPGDPVVVEVRCDEIERTCGNHDI